MQKFVAISEVLVTNVLNWERRSGKCRDIKKTTPASNNRIIVLAKRNLYVRSRNVRRPLLGANLPLRMARKIPFFRKVNLEKREDIKRNDIKIGEDQKAKK